jgi:hypothetical protein
MLGLDRFREYFASQDLFYVVIGGTACAIVFEELQLSFRSTKDIDMVIIAEAMDADEMTLMRRFIAEGGYQAWKLEDGTVCRYRFAHPTDASFPSIIELFSKEPIPMEHIRGIGRLEAPDDLSSFSVILLHQDVYNFIKSHAKSHDGVWIMEAPDLIALKSVAWKDNRDRKEKGERVKSDDVKKHLIDIVRLIGIVSPVSRVQLPEGLMLESIKDVDRFMSSDEFFLQYGKRIDVPEYIRRLRDLYELSDPSNR